MAKSMSAAHGALHDALTAGPHDSGVQVRLVNVGGGVGGICGPGVGAGWDPLGEVGNLLGADVGTLVGFLVGFLVGSAVGFAVGLKLGASLRPVVQSSVFSVLLQINASL